MYVSHSFDRPSELVARRMPLCFVAELLDRVKPVTADIRHGGGDVVAEWFQRVDGKLVRSYKYARDTERFALEYRPELTK